MAVWDDLQKMRQNKLDGDLEAITTLDSKAFP